MRYLKWKFARKVASLLRHIRPFVRKSAWYTSRNTSWIVKKFVIIKFYWNESAHSNIVQNPTVLKDSVHQELQAVLYSSPTQFLSNTKYSSDRKIFRTNAVHANEHKYYLLHIFSISLTALYIIKEKQMNAAFLSPVHTHVVCFTVKLKAWETTYGLQHTDIKYIIDPNSEDEN